MCGCKGGRWQAPAPAQVLAARTGTNGGGSQPQGRTRELIPGGYWNGPKAKKKN